MFKLERILVQTCKDNKYFKPALLSSKLFTTDKIPADISQSSDSQTNLREKSDENKSNNVEATTVSDFVKAFAKQTTHTKEQEEYKESTEQNHSFASLLRHSNLMHMGDPEGKIVVGKVFEVVNNDLYIDFGWKFHCVCPKPIKNNSDYVRGAKVRLRVKDLELSTRFLGSTKDVTLLEADCVLLGLVSTPSRITKVAEKPTVTPV